MRRAELEALDLAVESQVKKLSEATRKEAALLAQKRTREQEISMLRGGLEQRRYAQRQGERRNLHVG